MSVPENTDKQQENSRPWLKDHQFKSGQSGNPNGRPKSKTIPELLRSIGTEDILNDPFIPDNLKEKFKKSETDYSKLDAVLRMVYIYALQGEAWAVNFIAERTEGKAPQTITLQEEHIFIDIVDPDGVPVDVDEIDNSHSTDNG